jgi:hypothetical protein
VSETKTDQPPPEDEGLERIDPEAELVAAGEEREPDSWLPRWLVDHQAELADVGAVELGQRMADLVIAAALRDTGATPKGVLAELLEGYHISDESWRGKVGPELRRLLAARGVELEP